MKLSSILLACAFAAGAQDKPMDIERSSITVHVGKAGLLSAAGHEHWVSAPISSGTIGDARVEFTVDAAKMRVKPDPKVSAKDQAQIQKDMEEMTLEPAKFPAIVFKSTRVEKTGEGQWKVEGTLALHGVTKPVGLAVSKNGEAYTGHATIKQTDFGIKPVSVGGGAVKVKNEVDIEFQIFSRP
jgi:polyisoprenoid-binding protein YceI